MADLPWLSRWVRVTIRLAECIVRLCRVPPVQRAAAWYYLDWDTVKALDKAALATGLLSVDLAQVTVIAMDEFALRRGHRYATVILEPSRKQVLGVGRGRAREDVRLFFAQSGPERCKRLQAVVMDMNPASEEEVPAQCPQVLQEIRCLTYRSPSAEWGPLNRRGPRVPFTRLTGLVSCARAVRAFVERDNTQ